MREKHAGHLIYISSISGLVPDVSGAAYQAAKRGFSAWRTPFAWKEKKMESVPASSVQVLSITEILEKRPIRRPAETLAKAMQPEDVAEAVLYVAKLPPGPPCRKCSSCQPTSKLSSLHQRNASHRPGKILQLVYDLAVRIDSTIRAPYNPTRSARPPESP